MKRLPIYILILAAGFACDSDTGWCRYGWHDDDDSGMATMVDAAVIDAVISVTDNASWLYARDGHSGDGPAATTVVRRGERENEWVRRPQRPSAEIDDTLKATSGFLGDHDHRATDARCRTGHQDQKD